MHSRQEITQSDRAANLFSPPEVPPIPPPVISIFNRSSCSRH